MMGQTSIPGRHRCQWNTKIFCEKCEVSSASKSQPVLSARHAPSPPVVIFRALERDTFQYSRSCLHTVEMAGDAQKLSIVGMFIGFEPNSSSVFSV
jgi:hypothetical protein